LRQFAALGSKEAVKNKKQTMAVYQQRIFTAKNTAPAGTKLPAQTCRTH
jgi:hypothetical protein